MPANLSYSYPLFADDACCSPFVLFGFCRRSGAPSCRADQVYRLYVLMDDGCTRFKRKNGKSRMLQVAANPARGQQDLRQRRWAGSRHGKKMGRWRRRHHISADLPALGVMKEDTKARLREMKTWQGNANQTRKCRAAAIVFSFNRSGPVDEK